MIASVSMVVDDGETSAITAQVDSGSGFVTVAAAGDALDVTGTGVGGSTTSKQSLSFIVPTNSVYKIISSGTGANTLDALQEMNM